MSIPKDPFDGLILDDEEQAIEDALERGEYVQVGYLEDTKKMLQEADLLHTKLNNTKPITLRVNQLDLIKIKAKAKRNNIPYQTLLSSMIHDYADGNRDLIIK